MTRQQQLTLTERTPHEVDTYLAVQIARLESRINELDAIIKEIKNPPAQEVSVYKWWWESVPWEALNLILDKVHSTDFRGYDYFLLDYLKDWVKSHDPNVKAETQQEGQYAR